MKFAFCLGIALLLSCSASYAVGSLSVGNKINYGNLPGSSFILESNTAYVPPGSSPQKIAQTQRKCPNAFIPTVTTSLNDTQAQTSTCPITAIHATGANAEDNGSSYNIMIAQVSVESTKQPCNMQGLKLNWSVYCMPTKSG